MTEVSNLARELTFLQLPLLLPLCPVGRTMSVGTIVNVSLAGFAKQEDIHRDPFQSKPKELAAGSVANTRQVLEQYAKQLTDSADHKTGNEIPANVQSLQTALAITGDLTAAKELALTVRQAPRQIQHSTLDETTGSSPEAIAIPPLPAANGTLVDVFA